MKKIQFGSGKLLMIISALLSAVGQLYWKWGNTHFTYYFIGFLLYGMGALFMFKSLAREKLSVAYPLMSTGYIFALFIGSIFLHETISYQRLIAVILLIAGVFLTSYEQNQESGHEYDH